MRKLLPFLFILAAQIAQAAIIDELTPAERQDLLNGKLIMTTKEVPGYPWPEMRFYRMVSTSAEETMAVAIDYELRPQYTPDLSFAKIAKIINPRTVEVDYILQLPIIGPEHFTLKHTISTYASEKSYRMDLKLVRADRTRKLDGLSLIEPLDGKSIFCMVSFIDPGVPMAQAMRSRAIRQAYDAAEGFAAQVEKEKRTQPELLGTQVRILRAALALQHQ